MFVSEIGKEREKEVKGGGDYVNQKFLIDKIGIKSHKQETVL